MEEFRRLQRYFFHLFFPFFLEKERFRKPEAAGLLLLGQSEPVEVRSSAARRQPCFSSAGELDANLRLPPVRVSKCIRHPR